MYLLYFLQTSSKSPTVKSMLAATIASASGQVSNYVLASDDCKMLHFLQQDTTVHRVQTPAVVTSVSIHWTLGDEVDMPLCGWT